MKNLVGFNLFENSGFNYDELFLKKDYKKHLEFALSGIAMCNEDKDFLRWAAYKAYFNNIMEMGVPDNILTSLEPAKKTPYPNGYLTSFDFDVEISKDSSLGVKSVSWLIKNFLMEPIKRIPPSESAVTIPVKNVITKAVHDSIKNVFSGIFLPGNINNIQKLKYLDYLRKYTHPNSYRSLMVDELVVSELDINFKEASDLYKGIEFSAELGGRIFNFLKIFSVHNMEYFKEIHLPERMANYVVLYFRESSDSFKTADELRKSNVQIYNRIKELLPDIDTAADLGDLGF